MNLVVEQASVFMSIQDAGRFGFLRYGLPESGPMDWWAHHAANLLVGNDPTAACVEVGFSDAHIVVGQRSLLSVAGAGYRLLVNGREFPLWMAFLTKPGDRLQLNKIQGGNWVYLAVSGGFQSEAWMGSYSAFPLAGLGRNLTSGDRLHILPAKSDNPGRAGIVIPASCRPPYGDSVSLRMIYGPHLDRITTESQALFWESSYTVTSQSNRMGYRLAGLPLAHQHGADLISQGMVQGQIQVPGDGLPIVMMADHPTTGGYTCIGTVIKVDLPLLAQLEPAVGQMFFQPCELNQARLVWRTSLEEMHTAVLLQEDLWLEL